MFKYQLYGGGFAVIAIAVIAGVSGYDRAANYVSTTGKVFGIERTCSFDTVSGAGRKSVSEDRCDSTDEFEHIGDKPTKKIVGKAKLHISYVSPIDKSDQTSVVELDGGDDEFYKIHRDDEVKILVSKTDPTKIRLD
jgi:hypothetical protein